MSALDAVGLTAYPLRTLMDVERLRVLRNECRWYMTGDTSEISMQAQTRWYAAYRMAGPVAIRVWLIFRTTDIVPIGFLSLRYRHRSDLVVYAVLTLGLTEQARERGYGTAIYRYARDEAGCEVRATILRTNHRSLRAATTAGYRVLDDGDERTVTLAATTPVEAR